MSAVVWRVAPCTKLFLTCNLDTQGRCAILHDHLKDTTDCVYKHSYKFGDHEVSIYGELRIYCFRPRHQATYEILHYVRRNRILTVD